MLTLKVKSVDTAFRVGSREIFDEVVGGRCAAKGRVYFISPNRINKCTANG